MGREGKGGIFYGWPGSQLISVPRMLSDEEQQAITIEKTKQVPTLVSVPGVAATSSPPVE